MNTQLLACNSDITYADVFGPNYKMNTQLLACNSDITYADVFGPNYNMNTQLQACNSNIMKAGAVRVKGLVYGMSGILIPCLSDAALPEFMVLCIRQQDVRGPPSKKDFNFGTHKNDTNYFVFSA